MKENRSVLAACSNSMEAKECASVPMLPTAPSLTYLVRIMRVLASRSELTVTNLAMMSRINHQRCSALLEWLQDSGYAQARLVRKRRFIALTEIGRDFANRLLEVNDMTHFPFRSQYKMHIQNVNEPY